MMTEEQIELHAKAAAHLCGWDWDTLNEDRRDRFRKYTENAKLREENEKLRAEVERLSKWEWCSQFDEPETTGSDSAAVLQFDYCGEEYHLKIVEMAGWVGTGRFYSVVLFDENKEFETRDFATKEEAEAFVKEQTARELKL